MIVFLVGLWVGGNVIFNRFMDILFLLEIRENRKIFGVLSIFKGEKGFGEFVQVLECFVCGSIFVVFENGGILYSFIFYIVVEISKNLNFLLIGVLSIVKFKVL